MQLATVETDIPLSLLLVRCATLLLFVYVIVHIIKQTRAHFLPKDKRNLGFFSINATFPYFSPQHLFLV